MTRFDHRDEGRDDETWRALPQWRAVPALELSLGAEAAEEEEEESTLVVVVAHPDDETLACGGLLARAAEQDVATVVLVATDGEASHPDSPTHTPGELAGRRRAEVGRAVSTLHPRARLIRLGLPDGGLAEHVGELTDRLEVLVDHTTLVVSTWRHDGHEDHEVVGRVAADVAARAGARHLEAPLWLWFWGDPADVPWDQCAVLPLTPDQREAKAAALGCYPSQTAPLSDAAGDEVVLGERMLAAFRRPFETYVEQPGGETRPSRPGEVFEELHRRDQDPWRTRTSWYESRRRALALALLPRQHVGSVLEIGCSVGELTAALASRADAVLAVDVSAAALAIAADRCSGLPVTFRQQEVPREWPEGAYDVVVLSEVGYFLSASDLDETLRQACRSLTPVGALLLVHWRHDVEGWPLDGPAVHVTASRVAVEHGLTVATRVADDDVLLDLYRPGDRLTLAEEEREERTA